MAAPADSRRLGFPDAAEMTDGATVYVALPRQAVIVSVIRHVRTLRTRLALEIVEAGRYRRATDGRVMMDPEASVSALAFQHPDCTYFSVCDDA